MKKCNGGETCPVSGENICCKSCEKLQTCEDACNEALDLTATCPDEVEEPDALTVFRTKETAVIQAMTDLLTQKKALEEKEKKVREKLVETMGVYGVKSFENDLLRVTYIDATTKTTTDTKALKKDYPDIAKKYSKTSPVAAFVRISLK